MDKNASIREHLSKAIGKTIFLRRKSTPDFLIIGEIMEVYDDSLYINSNSSMFIVGFDDIYTADIKSRTKRKQTEG